MERKLLMKNTKIKFSVLLLIRLLINLPELKFHGSNSGVICAIYLMTSILITTNSLSIPMTLNNYSIN